MSLNTPLPKTALVTGGSRGLGRAMCMALAELGYRVAVNFVAQRGLDRTDQRQRAGVSG